MIILQNDPLKLRFVSKPMEDITGYSLDELKSMSPEQCIEVIHPEDRNKFFQNFEKKLSGQKSHHKNEYRIIHKNKSIRWVKVYSELISYENNPALQAVLIDNTCPSGKPA